MKTVGIDIGGTQLRAAIFDEGRRMTGCFKTGNDRSLTPQQNLDRLIDFILSRPGPYRGIGVGCPGPLDLRQGRVLCPPNLVGWDGFELVKYIEGRTHLPTQLNNDANLSGLAEALLGAGAGYESVVFVGISTGIGGAYVYQGRLVNGAHANAAEFWNMIVNEDPHCHKNANPGSLNEQSSGSGLSTLAAERYGRPVAPKELFALCREKDPRAVEIVGRAAEALAKGLANISCTIDPDIIILGGSVMLHNPDYVALITEKARRYAVDPGFLKIAPARFGDDAGLIGASLLVCPP